MGKGKLSDLLLSATQAELSKNPKNANLAGSEGGELWYNQGGS